MNRAKPAARGRAIETFASLLLLSMFVMLTAVLIHAASGVFTRVSQAAASGQEDRTALNYVATVVRQADSVRVDAIEGVTALVATRHLGGAAYETWIFWYNGALREVMLAQGAKPMPGAASPIAKARVEFAQSGASVTARSGGGPSLTLTPRAS